MCLYIFSEMSKASVFVVLCSISIIVLFSLFCYLLHSITPDPFDNATNYRRVSDIKEDSMYINDALNFEDHLHFGLKKAPPEYEIKTEAPWNDDHLRSKSIQIPLVRYTSGTTVTNTTKYEKFYEDIKPVTVLVYPFKDVRRSVEANNSSKFKEGQTKNVLLKIIDDSGKARMEVIVDSGQIHYKDQSISNQNETKELKVYEIKPNSTILYNVAEQSLKILTNDLPKTKSTV